MKRSEAVARRCSVKKVFLKISQNSHEKPVPGSFFNKYAGIGLYYWLLGTKLIFTAFIVSNTVIIFFQFKIKIMQISKKKSSLYIFLESRKQICVQSCHQKHVPIIEAVVPRCSSNRYFADFTGNYQLWSLFSIKLQVFRPAALLKGDSNAVGFL